MTYPDPINQFSRLVHLSGPTGTGSYSLGSRWNNVRDGRNYDSANCTAAMGALAINAHTGGRITSNPAQIRNHQFDFSGGIGLDDVNVAWNNLWPGNQLVLPQAHDWADVLASVREGRFVVIQGDNDQMGAWSCQAGGTFTHAYAIGDYRASDGRVLLYDPLCTKGRWIPQYAIRLAAEKLALAERGSKGRLFVGLTKVMPPPYDADVTYRYGGEPRFRGRYLARRDDVPIRSRPDPAAAKVAELDHREAFACRQSAFDGRWLGTADGTKWVYREVMWYSGAITGTEKVS